MIVTIFVPVSKPAPSRVMSLAMMASNRLRSSFERALPSTLSLSAANPMTSWPFFFAFETSARMSGVGSSLSVRLSLDFLILLSARSAGR